MDGTTHADTSKTPPPASVSHAARTHPNTSGGDYTGTAVDIRTSKAAATDFNMINAKADDVEVLWLRFGSERGWRRGETVHF